MSSQTLEDFTLENQAFALALREPGAIEYFYDNLPSEDVGLVHGNRGINQFYIALYSFYNQTGIDPVDPIAFKSWIESESDIFAMLGGKDGVDFFFQELSNIKELSTPEAVTKMLRLRADKRRQNQFAAELTTLLEKKDATEADHTQIKLLTAQIQAINDSTSLDPFAEVMTGKDFAAMADRLWDLPDFLPTPFEDLNCALGYNVNGGMCKGAVSAILAPSGAGKPVADHEMVLLGDGRYVRLDSINVGDRVITHKGISQEVLAVHEQGTLDTVVIKTRHGRTLEAALDHPILTDRGWSSAGDLCVGDVVFSVSGYETDNAYIDEDPHSYSLEELWLSSYLDGVPMVVFKSSNDTVKQMLGLYFAQYGHTKTSKTKRSVSIEFRSSNKMLLIGIQRLMARVGFDTILEKRFGILSPLWRLRLCGDRLDMMRFAQDIPIPERFIEDILELSHVDDHKVIFEPCDLTKDTVDSITRSKSNCRCLTVDIDHTFIAGDLVVHNSTLSKVMANHWSSLGFRTLVINYEEAKDHYSRILMSQVVGKNVYLGQETSEEEKKRLTAQFKEVMEDWGDNIMVLPSPKTSYFEDLESLLREMAKTDKLPDAIIIDTINSMFLKRSSGGARWNQYEEIMVRLEKLAKDLGSAIIITAQENSNRMKENREKIKQSDAGGSLTIVQKCAVTMHIVPVRMSEAEDLDDIVEIQIPKNRITGTAFSNNPPKLRYNDSKKSFDEYKIIPDDNYEGYGVFDASEGFSTI